MSPTPEPVWAVVLAAGAATRFGSTKQFESLGGMRLVDRSISTAIAACGGCVVVLPDGVHWDGTAVDATVTGGATRADSVRAGLAAVPAEARIVVIHDAAHPLAPAALFEAIIARVREGYDGAVPVLAVRETVMRVADNDVVDGSVPRDGLHAVQMPHAFRAEVLRQAHERGIDAPDDASLVFAVGGRIATVPGDPRNVHVTTPDELALAQQLL
jgi:2-C-methyl-D-erythritol 4-phosphate cytidylyltransferase